MKGLSSFSRAGTFALWLQHSTERKSPQEGPYYQVSGYTVLKHYCLFFLIDSSIAITPLLLLLLWNKECIRHGIDNQSLHAKRLAMVGKSLQYGICTLDSLFVLFWFVEFDDMFERSASFLGNGRSVFHPLTWSAGWLLTTSLSSDNIILWMCLKDK